MYSGFHATYFPKSFLFIHSTVSTRCVRGKEEVLKDTGSEPDVVCVCWTGGEKGAPSQGDDKFEDRWGVSRPPATGVV